MFCAKCGTQNNDAAAFCRSCGGDVHAARAQAVSLQQPAASADDFVVKASAVSAGWLDAIQMPAEVPKYYIWLGLASLVGLVGMTMFLPLMVVTVGAIAAAALLAYKNTNGARTVLGASAVLTTLLVVLFFFARVLNVRPQGSAINGYMNFTMVLAGLVLVSSIVGYVMAFLSAKKQLA